MGRSRPGTQEDLGELRKVWGDIIHGYGLLEVRMVAVEAWMH